MWKQEDKMYVPKDAKLREECISMHHQPPYRGHVGRDRTYELLERHYYWPGMRDKVAHSVRHCQRNKASNQLPAGLPTPLQIPEG